MLANLSFNGRVGVQYTDNYNDPAGTTSVNPYADLSLIYTYLPGSYAQVGFTQTQNATDQVGFDSNGHITLNTGKFHALCFPQPQADAQADGHDHRRAGSTRSTMGVHYNNQADDYYSLGLNLSYSFNPHFSAEVGYNFDDLQSQIPGNEYTRNRVYLGVSAAY